MKLIRARVQNFKSVEDSGWVEIDDAVTCLVGKNESGKTAFLDALSRIKPVPGARGTFDYELEYSRRYLSDYRRIHATQPATVVQGEFELTATELAGIEKDFGTGCLTSPRFTASKDYANKTLFSIPFDEAVIVRHLVETAGLPAAHATKLSKLETVAALRARLTALESDPPQAAELLAVITAWREGDVGRAMIDAHLSPQMPAFFYFDDYSIMEGRIAVSDLIRKRDAGDLDDADLTFLALLDLVGVTLEEFNTQENRERLIALLEAAGNSISDELFKFWSQNKELAVKFDLSGPDAQAGAPFDQGTNLQVRIYNGRHRVTVPFDQRSRGFVWFFSFLAHFSEFDREEFNDVVLLLDEPGLNLHASAQYDFLRFIEERLAPEHQVVYSTHSPFLVDPAHLDRVRTVEDQDGVGTKISKDVLTTSRETVFPLQAALGYTLAQTLFVGQDNVLVEGPSDYLYFKVVSDHLRILGRTSLDDRWVIVPVGGLEKVPTFLALLNAQLNVAAVIDGSSGGVQRLSEMAAKGVIRADQVIPVTAITKTNAADIEDMFEEAFYLRLLKESGVGAITKAKLPPGNRIVKRVEEALGHPFDHYQPARLLLEKQTTLLKHLDADTLDRFDELFVEINKRL